jgi:hypothetical protein
MVVPLVLLLKNAKFSPKSGVSFPIKNFLKISFVTIIFFSWHEFVIC